MHAVNATGNTVNELSHRGSVRKERTTCLAFNFTLNYSNTFKPSPFPFYKILLIYFSVFSHAKGAVYNILMHAYNNSI